MWYQEFKIYSIICQSYAVARKYFENPWFRFLDDCQIKLKINLIKLDYLLSILNVWHKFPHEFGLHTAQKMKFSIKEFLSKCDQICSFLRTWTHSLNISLMENFIFCTVSSFRLSLTTYQDDLYPRLKKEFFFESANFIFKTIRYIWFRILYSHRRDSNGYNFRTYLRKFNDEISWNWSLLYYPPKLRFNS